MNAMIRTVACGLTLSVVACNAWAQAQDKPPGYPARPIRLVISVAPGAGADMIARATAQMLSERWGQNAVVDSRPGGGGVVAVELTARASPDGYTLLQYGDDTLTNRYNLWAPAGKPKPIIAAINRVVTEGMNSAEMVKRLANEGSEPAARMTPEELKATFAREYLEVERTVKQLEKAKG